MALDADYVLSLELIAELKALRPASDVEAYWISFHYCVKGRPLRGTLYPPVLALFRRDSGRYVQQGHTQRLVVEGQTGRLKAKIFHDDRKPLSRWLASQQRYARLEADYLLGADPITLGRSDRIRRMGWPAPPLAFLYTLIVKRCLLDGWPGWLYVLQRTLAETMIALEIVDRRMAAAQNPDVQGRFEEEAGSQVLMSSREVSRLPRRSGAGKFGHFPLGVSLEVVEHCYDSRKFARTLICWSLAAWLWSLRLITAI